MFELKHRQIQNLVVWEYSHLDKQFGFSLIPELGAMLLDVRMDGKEWLDAPKGYTEITTNPRYKGVLLAPFPNRLNQGKYTFNNTTYQFPINDTGTQNALHGTAYRKAFEVIETNCTTDSCHIELALSDKGETNIYPFAYEFSVRYELSIHTGFRVDLTCKNMGTNTMPIGLGWHPYFQLGGIIDTATLQLPSVEKIEVNNRMLPTGKRFNSTAFQQKKPIGTTPLDTCFFIKNNSQSPIAEVFLTKDQQQLRYWQKTGTHQFNYLQLYIPPDRSAIAIEPMTCSIDAFNNGDGLIILETGEVIKTSCGFELIIPFPV